MPSAGSHDTALVLSGGGLFGAWQAGAWSVLEKSFQPGLVVGASIGSLNGYLIASGISARQLAEYWLTPEHADLKNLDASLQKLTGHFRPRTRFAVTITDTLRMKPVIVQEGITWQHLSASCAVPLLLPQKRIGGRWYTDGGLLNPLPVWAAVELGARRIVALNCLPEFPVPTLKPFVKAFQWTLGHHPALPEGVEVRTIVRSRRLGSLRDALRWKRENIEQWLQMGAEDAAKHFPLNL